MGTGVEGGGESGGGGGGDERFGGKGRFANNGDKLVFTYRNKNSLVMTGNTDDLGLIHTNLELNLTRDMT